MSAGSLFILFRVHFFICLTCVIRLICFNCLTCATRQGFGVHKQFDTDKQMNKATLSHAMLLEHVSTPAKQRDGREEMKIRGCRRSGPLQSRRVPSLSLFRSLVRLPSYGSDTARTRTHGTFVSNVVEVRACCRAICFQVPKLTQLICCLCNMPTAKFVPESVNSYDSETNVEEGMACYVCKVSCFCKYDNLVTHVQRRCNVPLEQNEETYMYKQALAERVAAQKQRRMDKPKPKGHRAKAKAKPEVAHEGPSAKAEDQQPAVEACQGEAAEQPMQAGAEQRPCHRKWLPVICWLRGEEDGSVSPSNVQGPWRRHLQHSLRLTFQSSSITLDNRSVFHMFRQCL